MFSIFNVDVHNNLRDRCRERYSAPSLLHIQMGVYTPFYSGRHADGFWIWLEELSMLAATVHLSFHIRTELVKVVLGFSPTLGPKCDQPCRQHGGCGAGEHSGLVEGDQSPSHESGRVRTWLCSQLILHQRFHISEPQIAL